MTDTSPRTFSANGFCFEQSDHRFSQSVVVRIAAQAARHAGYAESIARKPAKITNSPAVRTALVELLEEAGVTDSMLAARIREGLDATDAEFVTTRAGKTQRIDVVDFATRRSCLVMALKLKGLLPRRNTEHRATLEEILEKASLPS